MIALSGSPLAPTADAIECALSIWLSSSGEGPFGRDGEIILCVGAEYLQEANDAADSINRTSNINIEVRYEHSLLGEDWYILNSLGRIDAHSGMTE